MTLLAIAAVFALSTGAASAQSESTGQTEPTDQANKLQPGEYRQLVAFRPAAPVTVVVDIPSQIAGVYQQGQLVAVTTVSTGRPGHETPIGAFRVMGKEVDHHSNLYNNASMPYMQRLTSDGVAIHAGKITGVPSSHGCIRMPLGMAKLLYGATKVGTEVYVLDRPATPVEVETADRGRDDPASSPAG